MFTLNDLEKIKDEEIREGLRAAITKNLLPAQKNIAYFGQFSVVADGSAFGVDYTWPGLDSWEMAGAYLLMGYTKEVLGYFDFVQASQRADGNIPFAIWPAEEYASEESRKTTSRGLKYPDDVFSYTPPTKGYPTRNWIGLFRHWVAENPLSSLASICYLLTAAEIYSATQDVEWVNAKLPSLDKAGTYLLHKKSAAGLIGGAGFYIELPPRQEWDGITQCYAYKAFKDLANLYAAVKNEEKTAFWNKEADILLQAFQKNFWTGDHFAEYIHPEHGPVDFHGFTDVDWCAIGCGLADEEQKAKLAPKLLQDENFWWGDMPTQAVTKPYLFREWEMPAPVGFTPHGGPIYDIAAIGRIFYVEMTACKVLGETERIKQAVKLVCRRGLEDGGYWRERYHMLQNRTAYGAGPKGYCEYPAVLTRIILSNWELFT